MMAKFLRIVSPIFEYKQIGSIGLFSTVNVKQIDVIYNEESQWKGSQVLKNSPKAFFPRKNSYVRCCFRNTNSSSLFTYHQSRRNMSILTDLLRRTKRNEDEDEGGAIPDAKVLPLFEDSPRTLSEEEIVAKRNISRLNEYDQRLIHGQPPHQKPMHWAHHTVRYRQKLFGKYGESSGVNPGVLWPTREELKNKIEYENICRPFTIMEAVERIRAKKQEENEQIERRVKEVEKKMTMVDKFKEDLKLRQEGKERESNEAKARREKLMEEVRRHFGFSVDSRDDRFQEMLAKKEKEQRKNLKEARKLEKQKRMLDKLEGKSASIKGTKASKTTDASDEKNI